ncbi:MAG TPA: hypothetical protein V6D05_10480 [Stenomitos sp.]
MNRIRLKQGDRELEIEGEAGFIEAHLEKLMGVAFGGPLPEPTASREEIRRVPASFAVKKNLSLADFLELKEPQNLVDRLLVLAYYMEKYEAKVAYTLAELTEHWESQWPELPLAEETWQAALERGYLQWQEDGRLTLSFVGHHYVRDGLA